ncbi:hypothetical protein [Bacillus safensis]|uniref:hypothetical protein n=1 Tax=Bacillus safensis TaxID=561879 RepID=UPI002E216E34|nr:hypothetical protein [Bacillus safensis]
MIVNVTTDCKTLTTKNLWHLLFLLIYLLIGGFLFGKWLIMLCAFVISFILGLSLTKIPHVSLGAGDIKMLIVISLYNQLIWDDNPLILIGLFIGMYVVFSFSHTLISRLYLKNKRKFSYSYKIEKGVIITPEAVPLFITVLLFNVMGGIHV